MHRAFASIAVCLSVTAPRAVAQGVASITLSHKTVQLRVGQRTGVYATANDARGVVLVGQRFEWTTSDPAIVRVEVDREQPDLAYLVGAGAGLAQVQVRVGSRTDAVAVQVSPAEPAPAAAAPAGPPPAILRIEPANILLIPVETRPLSALFLGADGTPAAASPVTWRSHNPAVATVTEDGRVVGQSQGRGVIEARAASGLVATASVEVALAGIAFPRPVLGLSPGSEVETRVVVPVQNDRVLPTAAFSWRTSDPAVASVSPLGVVRGVGPGRATVTAEGLGRSATLEVSVHRAVAELRWLPRRDQGPVIVPLHGAVAFSVEALDRDGRPVTEAPFAWAVADTAVAAFDTASRRLHGRALGRTRLELKGPGAGLDVTWDVQVIAGGVLVTPGRAGLGVRDTVRLAASWTDDRGRAIGAASDLEWATTNPGVAAVTAAGRVTGVGLGGARIVAATAWGKADTADIYVLGRVLFTSNREGSPDLYAVDPETPAALTRITSDPGVETMGGWSPDGASIVFVSNRGGSFDLWIANADGTSPRRLTETPATETSPRWTPDGRTIVFSAPGEGGRAQVWAVGADGGDARLLTTGDATNIEPAVSPDGGTVAFTSTRDGNYEIYLMGLDGSEQRNVSRSPQKESHPAWLPDGRLAYLQERGERRTITPMVAVHDLRAGQRTTVSPPDLAVTDFAVSAAGDMLALEVSAAGAGGRFERRLVFLPLLAGGARVELPRRSAEEQMSSPSFRSRGR